MVDIGEFHSDQPKRTRRPGSPRLGSREKQPAGHSATLVFSPAVTSSEPALPSWTAVPSGAALATFLTKRVRISLADSVRWVSGYTVFASKLRRRAAVGEARALKLLERLDQYRAEISASGATQPGTALPTPHEHELNKAFIRRTLERVAAQRASEPPSAVVKAPPVESEALAPTKDRRSKRSRRSAGGSSRRSFWLTNGLGRNHDTK